MYTHRERKSQEAAKCSSPRPASWEADPGYYYNFSHLGCSPPNIIVNHKNNLVDIAFGWAECAARPMLLIGREWRSAANFIFIDWWMLRAYNLTEYYYITTVLPNGGAPPTKQSLAARRDTSERSSVSPQTGSTLAFCLFLRPLSCRLDKIVHRWWIYYAFMSDVTKIFNSISHLIVN